MPRTPAAHRLPAQESSALSDRLKWLRPFALLPPMVPAVIPAEKMSFFFRQDVS